MTTTIDINALLVPIPGENPSGEDMRYTLLYDDIKEARRADDAFAMGDWQRDIKTSDWDKVISLSVEALTEKTKDLQVAAWLCEALVETGGFHGLSLGIELVGGLTDLFWDNVYPLIDGDDLDYRIAPFDFINDRLCSAVKLVALTEPGATPGYSLVKWQESRDVGREADTKNKYGDIDEQKKKRRDELLEEGKISAEEFDASVIKSSVSFYKALVMDLGRCREVFKALDIILDDKFGNNAPRISDLGQALEECERIAVRISREQKGLPDEIKAAPVEDNPTSEDQPEITVKEEIPAEVPVSVVEQEPLPMLPVTERPASVMSDEDAVWADALKTMENGGFKAALDRLLKTANSQPSERGRSRFTFLVAKLCLKAGRAELARPIMEQLNARIAELQLERWESPQWIAEVFDALYQCLVSGEPSEEDMTRAGDLFMRICTLDVTKALPYRK